MAICPSCLKIKLSNTSFCRIVPAWKSSRRALPFYRTFRLYLPRHECPFDHVYFSFPVYNRACLVQLKILLSFPYTTTPTGPNGTVRVLNGAHSGIFFHGSVQSCLRIQWQSLKNNFLVELSPLGY